MITQSNTRFNRAHLINVQLKLYEVNYRKKYIKPSLGTRLARLFSSLHFRTFDDVLKSLQNI
jgi:hypothetical protein